MWVAVAAIGGAAVAGYASNKGARTQATSAKEASNAELEMFYQNREDLAPWRKKGAAALKKYDWMIRKGPGNFKQSPGYQFRLNEGMDAIDRVAASRGMYDSGDTGKALLRYNQNYATNEYDNFLRRWYEKLNLYGNLAGIGQVAATDTARMGTQVADDVAANTMTAGAARASGYNAVGNYINQGVDSAMSNYLMKRYLDQNAQN